VNVSVALHTFLDEANPLPESVSLVDSITNDTLRRGQCEHLAEMLPYILEFLNSIGITLQHNCADGEFLMRPKEVLDIFQSYDGDINKWREARKKEYLQGIRPAAQV
jgi:hypothetical protein